MSCFHRQRIQSRSIDSGDSRGCPEMSAIASTRPCDSAAARALTATASRKPRSAIVETSGEALKRDSGEAAAAQRVPIDCLRVVGGVQLRRPAIGQRERRVAALVRRELRDVGPHVHAKRGGARRLSAAKPVLPRSERRPIVWTPEPALIAEHQLPIERRRIDG